MPLKTWVTDEKLNASDLNDNFQKVGSDVDMVIPTFNGIFNTSSFGQSALSDTTSALVSRFTLSKSIVINKISIYETSSGGWTGKLAIYNKDGSSKLTEITISPAAGGMYTYTLGASLELREGDYYIAVVPVTGTARFAVWAVSGTLLNMGADVTGQPKVIGLLTVAAATLPSTFDPTSLSTATSAVMFRLDN